MKFSRDEAISYGYETTKKHFGFLFLMLLVSFLVSISLEISKAGIMQIIPQLMLLVILGELFVITPLLTMGQIRICLSIHDEQTPRLSYLFTSYNLIFKFVLAQLLLSLIVMVGLCLFIIPGIIWAIKYGYFGYFIVDEECGPIEALNRSAKITDGAKFDLFILGLLLFLINLAGLLCFVVGLLFTIPMSILVSTHVYRRLNYKVKLDEVDPERDPAQY